MIKVTMRLWGFGHLNWRIVKKSKFDSCLVHQFLILAGIEGGSYGSDVTISTWFPTSGEGWKPNIQQYDGETPSDLNQLFYIYTCQIRWNDHGISGDLKIYLSCGKVMWGKNKPAPMFAELR